MRHRTRDYIHTHTGYRRAATVCRVETWEREGYPPIIVVSERVDNPGLPIAHLCSVLAAHLVAQYFPEAFESMSLVPFCYYERWPPSLAAGTQREILARVTFASQSPRSMDGMAPRSQMTLGRPRRVFYPREALEFDLRCIYPEPIEIDEAGEPVPRTLAVLVDP